MNKKNIRNLLKISLPKAVLLWLVLVSLFLAYFYVSGPFLKVGDASAHLAVAEYLREFGWPRFQVWNSQELLGWPQGTFYPPLLHWLAAGLGFLLGVESAFKLLLSLALVFLPVSLYFYARSLSTKPTVIVATAMLFLTLAPSVWGSGFGALFEIGLLSNFFVLPLLFFFLASLHKEKTNYFLSAGLFSLIVLTHIVGALVALTYLVSFSFSRMLLDKGYKISFSLTVLILTASMTSFFWIPFIANFSLTSVSRHLSSHLTLNVVALLFSLLFFWSSWRRREADLLTLSLTSLLFSLLVVIDSLLLSFLGSNHFLYSFHAYRYQPFIYLFLTIRGLLFFRKFIYFEASSVLVFLAFIAALIIELPQIKNPSQQIENPQAVKGRFLEDFSRTQVDPFWYLPQTQILKNQGAEWSYGLFTDSSPNGPFLESLKKSLNKEIYPPNEGDLIETKFISRAKANQFTDYFGIDYLLTFREDAESQTFTPIRINTSSRFEVVDKPLVPIKKNWAEKIEEWWLADGGIDQIPYFSTKTDLENGRIQNGQVKIKKTIEGGTKFVLQIDAEQQVPVLAKISYFPYWQASSNGVAVPIYRAAPNLMLFEGKGEVVLEYKIPDYLYALQILSAFSLLIALFLQFNPRYKSTKAI